MSGIEQGASGALLEDSSQTKISQQPSAAKKAYRPGSSTAPVCVGSSDKEPQAFKPVSLQVWALEANKTAEKKVQTPPRPVSRRELRGHAAQKEKQEPQ